MIFAGSQTTSSSCARKDQKHVSSSPFSAIRRAIRCYSVSVLTRRTNSPTMQVRANSLTMRSIVPHARRTRDWLSTVRSPGRPHTNFSRPDVPIAPSLRPRQAIGSTMNVTASAPTLRRAVRRASSAAAVSPKVRSRESISRSASPVSGADTDRDKTLVRDLESTYARDRAQARGSAASLVPPLTSASPPSTLFFVESGCAVH